MNMGVSIWKHPLFSWFSYAFFHRGVTPNLRKGADLTYSVPGHFFLSMVAARFLPFNLGLLQKCRKLLFLQSVFLVSFEMDSKHSVYIWTCFGGYVKPSSTKQCFSTQMHLTKTSLYINELSTLWPWKLQCMLSHYYEYYCLLQIWKKNINRLLKDKKVYTSYVPFVLLPYIVT